MQLKLLIIFSVLFTNCLKAKRSPFDVTSKSSSTASYFVGSGKLASLETNPSSPIVSTTTPTATTTSTAVTPPNAPASVSYGASSSFKLIPGNAVNFTPSVSGVVDSWTITPTLPTGLTFDASTGSITGTPSSAIYLNGGFPLTAYTITAQNSGGKIDFNLSLQILGTGENVWTVLNGVSGQDTANGYVSGYGSLFFHTATNSLYAGGSTKGALDGEPNPYPGISTSFATKYDLDGKRLWTRVIPLSTGGFWQKGLTIDSNANVFIAGNTWGSAGGTYDGQSVTGGDGSLGITKIDSNGNKQWTVVKNGGSELEVAGISADASGNVYASGRVKGDLDLITNTGGSDSAMTLIKYNTNGTWLQTSLAGSIGGGNHIGGSATTVDVSGNIWVAGVSQSTGARCATALGQRTIVLYKFNSSMLFQNCYALASTATAGYNFPHGLTSDPSGNIYVTGQSASNLDGLPKVSAAGTSHDAFIAKFNSNGTVAWKRQLSPGGTTETKAYAITRSPDDFYYITGETNGNLAGQTLNGVKDLFVAKYSSSGNLEWVKLIGSAGSTTYGTGIAFDTNNTLYLSGTSNGDIGGVTNPVKPNYAHMLTRFVK